MIVFCTTCKNRTQHLQQTLPKNLADNADYKNCKFLVLGYGAGQNDLRGYIDNIHVNAIESGRLVYYDFLATGPFHMAHAKNMAHRLGILEGGDILVNLDADNFTGPNFAAHVDKKFDSGIFMWAKMQPGVLDRGISGRIVVSADAFIKAGGYDEKYDAWGHDDKDFNARLRRLGYKGIEIDPAYLSAVKHNDKMRFREYPHARVAAEMGEDELELAAADNTIVNYGKFGMGTVYRNFDPTPIILGPVPTRVFGIGMHKTATTSLHKAFKILGLDSAHWKSAHWAKAIYDQMLTSGRSRTLEEYYALTDLPITLLYKELDKAYPGSKFILTTRNEQAWLNSVRKHWSTEHNEFRSGWDNDPFTHRVHKALYGMKNFHPDTFIARYRRHNAEVREYFKDRPLDLLLMNMEEGDKYHWFRICDFLDKPVPSVDYPTEYATTSVSKPVIQTWTYTPKKETPTLPHPSPNEPRYDQQIEYPIPEGEKTKRLTWWQALWAWWLRVWSIILDYIMYGAHQ